MWWVLIILLIGAALHDDELDQDIDKDFDPRIRKED